MIRVRIIRRINECTGDQVVTHTEGDCSSSNAIFLPAVYDDILSMVESFGRHAKMYQRLKTKQRWDNVLVPRFKNLNEIRALTCKCTQQLRRKWSRKESVTTRHISFQSILGHARNFELLQSNGNLYERWIVYFLLKHWRVLIYDITGYNEMLFLNETFPSRSSP